MEFHVGFSETNFSNTYSRIMNERPFISPWGWSFLSPFVLIFYDLNSVKITLLHLLLVNAALEGCKWPWLILRFHKSKLFLISENSRFKGMVGFYIKIQIFFKFKTIDNNKIKTL